MLFVGLGAAAVATTALVVAALQPRTPQAVSAPPAASAEFTFETDRRTAVLFIGDSYSAGAGASDPSKRWTTLVAREQDWFEVNKALGGTGYVVSSDERGCGKEYCEPYPELVGTLTNIVPDQIIVSGGRNDGGVDRREFRTGVEATFTALEERFPGIPIAVTLPLGDDDTPTSALHELARIVTKVAKSHNVRVIDIGQPLLGHPEYVTDDSVHPNNAGHRAIADAFNAAW